MFRTLVRLTRTLVSSSARRIRLPRCLMLEVLEERTLLTGLGFDPRSGWLSIVASTAGTAAQVAVTGDAVTVTVAGQLHSSDPATAAYDPALAGLASTSLRGIGLTGGGAADTLTLGDVTAPDLVAISDGGITVTGAVNGPGGLWLGAASLLDIEASGQLTGSAVSARADRVVNVGQVFAAGAVTISARDYLSGGTVDATRSVTIDFTESYIDTAAARTTAASDGSGGGQVTIDGGSTGRLFSSGRFNATGTTGGDIDLLGKDLLLIGATVDASGTVSGGRLRIGGDAHGANPAVLNAQTVNVSATTSLRAEGGGHVIVWSEVATTFAGSVAAPGGGFIEVSSRGRLTYGGQANAGAGGTLLLDPKNLTISTVANGPMPQFDLTDPGTGAAFGAQVVTLSTGNIVVTDPAANNNLGAVYLFSGQTGALLSTLVGSTGGNSGDQVGSRVTALTNGNFVVSSPAWNGGAGAVTWGSGTTGVAGVVSTTNSLTGTHANDAVGNSVTPLGNGNYVVSSPNWNGGIGAVTWGNGNTGIVGNVVTGNSLVGSQANDGVGTSITPLANGNYVVSSPNWNGNRGAATWGNGNTGVIGAVSTANSLAGTQPNDQVGFAVTPINNGNYVVSSQYWNAKAGAATWGNGTSGIVGTVSAANSLVGSQPNDFIGLSVTVVNGNYVVTSPDWHANTGAATWGNGATGIVGIVGSGNSLVGSQPNDRVGFSVTPLTNGNYVVGSPDWNGDIGAATWGNGTSGIVGTVSAGNSLVGSQANDFVGFSVTPLANGNYVVASNFWNGNTGAATWASGTTGMVGTVSAGNSLVGSLPNDAVAFSVTPLANGNYVVGSPDWNGNIGAATWGNGTSGIVGTVSAGNSLVGSQANDFVGFSVTPLTNGNYVVGSLDWNGKMGAVTWGNGTAGTVGTVAAGNSLVGSQANDLVGFHVIPLANGNYVVTSSSWNGNRGAATWGSGSTGIVGAVSAGNSLVGSQANDSVGSSVVLLADGSYVVTSPSWKGNTGAATWASGTSGSTLDGQNTVDLQNSLEGAAIKASPDLQVAPGAPSGFFIAAFSSENGGRVTVGLPAPNLLTFAALASQSVSVTPFFVTNSLNAGTNVILQANDDITLASALVTTSVQGGPAVGNLTLDAGRSIFINANLTTGGNLTLIANDTRANGVIDGQRDPGNAVITVTSSAHLQSNGALAIDLKTSSDKTNNGKGAATLLNLADTTGTLSATTVLGIAINGTNPGDGIVAGTYTQTADAGALNLNGAALQLTHTASTAVGSTFDIIHATAGGRVSGTFAGLPEGAMLFAPDGTAFTISYQVNNGADVVLTQVSTAGRPFAYSPATQTLTITSATDSDWFVFGQSTTGVGATVIYTFSMSGATTAFPDSQLKHVIVNSSGKAVNALLYTQLYYTDGTGLHEVPVKEQLLQGNGHNVLQKFDANNVASDFLTLNGFTNYYTYMNTASTATLYDAAGQLNSFYSYGTFSYLVGPGYFDFVWGPASTTAIAQAGSQDATDQFDGNALNGVGGSIFTVSGLAFSEMTGTDYGRRFDNKAVGFITNVGIAQNDPAQDKAIVYDSPYNDVLTANPSYVTMYAPGGPFGALYFDAVADFTKVDAFSFVGGTDTATNNDPAHVTASGFGVHH